jgi:hypothetical protein
MKARKAKGKRKTLKNSFPDRQWTVPASVKTIDSRIVNESPRAFPNTPIEIATNKDRNPTVDGTIGSV